jgi:type IV pilus assembly protein PilA
MKNKSAFTLIELLVVVAIIGILAAVGVVSFGGFTESAKVNVVKSNHNSIIKYLNTEIKRCQIQSSIQLKSTSNSQNINVIPCSKSTTDTATFFRAVQDHLNNEGFKNPYKNSEIAFFSSGGNSLGRTVGISYSGNLITVNSSYNNSSGNLEIITSTVNDER